MVDVVNEPDYGFQFGTTFVNTLSTAGKFDRDIRQISYVVIGHINGCVLIRRISQIPNNANPAYALNNTI